MTKDTEKRFDAVKKIMKRRDSRDRKNIMDSIRDMKNLEPQDAAEIDAHFADLCKSYDYDPVDFTSAKIVETK